MAAQSLQVMYVFDFYSEQLSHLLPGEGTSDAENQLSMWNVVAGTFKVCEFSIFCLGTNLSILFYKAKIPLQMLLIQQIYLWGSRFSHSSAHGNYLNHRIPQFQRMVAVW